MERTAYDEMYELEESHWWFRGRRAVIWALLGHATLPAGPRLLDAGCGTGRNLVEFGGLGPAAGVDPSADAVAFCHRRGLGDVQPAGLEALPFDEDGFDLLLACDVLEHVDDDGGGAPVELRRVAAPRGAPAHHRSRVPVDVDRARRPAAPRAALHAAACCEERARANGWTVQRASYFNSLALPAVAAAAPGRAMDVARPGRTDLDRTPAALNRVLECPMRMEAALIGRGRRLPAGVSFGMLCRSRG